MMNQLPKYVVSDSDYATTWTNSHLVSGTNLTAEVAQLKAQDGEDLAVFAGANVAQTFMGLELLDEYRLVANPIRLGGGTALFPSDGYDVPLDLRRCAGSPQEQSCCDTDSRLGLTPPDQTSLVATR